MLRLFCLLVLTALLAGCGSDSSPVTASTNLASVPAPPANDYHGLVLGRVLIDGPKVERAVKLFTADGALLHQTSTDKLGWWKVRAEMPPDFTVRAYDGNDAYAAEVRGGWHRGTLYVNAATTLASAWLRAHPGVSLLEAEQKVHDFLRLPAYYKLSWVSCVKAQNFNPANFFAQVRRAGLESYLATLVAQIDGRLSLKSLLDFALSLGTSALSGLYQSTVNDAVGSAVSHMGFNFTTAGALANVEAALNQVTIDLQQLTNAVNKSFINAALNATVTPMDQAVASNQQLSTNIYGQAEETLAYHNVPGNPGYNVPIPASSPLTALAATLRSNTAQTNNGNITRGLVPANVSQAAVYSFAAGQTALYSVDDAGSYGNYPWRGNYLTSQQQYFTAKYCNGLAQGANLLCEDAHVQNTTSQAGAINQATNATQALFGTIQTASQLVPDQLASDEVLLDMSSALMWYGSFMAADTWQNALDVAYNFEIGPYEAGGWALPDVNQLQNLLLIPRVLKYNGVFDVSNGSWGDYSTTDFTDAFGNLGFDTTNYVAYSENNHPNRSNDEGAWLSGADFSKSANTYLNLLFWNNTGNNPSTQAENVGSDKDTISYLIYYQYPGNAVPDAQPVEPLLIPLNGALGNSTDSFDQVVSPWASGFMNAPPTVSVQAQNGLGTQLKATQTFQAGGPWQPTTGFGNSATPVPFDVTARATWTSSNPEAATISNLAPLGSPFPSPLSSPVPIPSPGSALPTAPPGSTGFVTWHPPLSGSPLPSVTFTASLSGFTSSTGTIGTNSQSITVAPPSGLVPRLKQVQALPLNVIFDVNTSSTTNVFMGLCAYFVDGQCADVSTNANTTWQLFDSQGNPLNSGSVGGFVTTGTKNELILTGNISTSNVSVVGTYTSPWGTASSNVTLGLSKVVSSSPTPTPTPTPSGSPTVTSVVMSPASATWTSLPTTQVFNVLGTLSNGQTVSLTSSAIWQLQLPGGAGQVPASQGTIQVTTGGAIVTLNPSFTGTSVVVVAVVGSQVATATVSQASARTQR